MKELLEFKTLLLILLFENNMVSNILKLAKISWAASASDIWTVLKYLIIGNYSPAISQSFKIDHLH